MRSANTIVSKRGALTSIVVLVLFVVIAIYLFIHQPDVYNLTALSVADIMLIVTLFVVTLFLNGRIIQLLIRKLGGAVSWSDGFFMSVFTSFLNYILPMRGGAVARGVYLKKRMQFSYRSFAATLIAAHGILISIILLVAIGMSVIFVVQGVTAAIRLLIFLIVVLAVFVILLTRRGDALLRIPKVGAHIQKIWAGWSIIRGDRRLIGALCLYNILFVVCGACIVFSTFRSLGLPYTFADVLFIHTVSSLAFLINITPASIGIYEGALFISAEIININPQHTILFAIIFRMISFVTAGLLLAFFARSKLSTPAVTPGDDTLHQE